MNKIALLLILLLGFTFESKSQFDHSIHDKKCALYSSSLIHIKKYKFSGVDSVDFTTFKSKYDDVCSKFEESYALYDNKFNLVSKSKNGIFSNLEKNDKYNLYYQSNHPMSGGMNIMCVDEVSLYPNNSIDLYYKLYSNHVELNWTFSSSVDDLFVISKFENNSWKEIGKIHGYNNDGSIINYNFIYNESNNADYRIDYIEKGFIIFSEIFQVINI